MINLLRPDNLVKYEVKAVVVDQCIKVWEQVGVAVWDKIRIDHVKYLVREEAYEQL